MNETLKAVGHIGAELGAAKAENEAMREALRWYAEKVAECRKIGSLGDNARQALDLDGGFRARDAISKQAEPTDTYTAVEMATAAAQGFRDGQAAVEPAPAQDERELPPPYGWVAVGEFFTDRAKAIEAAEKTPCVEVYSRPQMLARPAQTEQQPIRLPERKPGSRHEKPHSDAHYYDYIEDPEGDIWNAALDEVARLYAAPIAQTAPHPEQLPYWEPCNPGCDPEFNGERSRNCATLCHNARNALSAQRGES